MTTHVPPTQDEAEFLLAMLEHSQDAIVGVRLDGTVVSWNRGAEGLYGYSSNEMVGQSLERLVAAGQEDGLVGAVSRVGEGRPVCQEAVHATKTGATIEVAVRLSPVPGRDGQIAGASLIVRDITALRRLAGSLGSMADFHSAPVIEGQEAQECCRRLLGDAAHQLRRPSTGVSAAVQALLLRGADPRDEQLLEAVAREVSRASRLIQNLLEVARLDQGHKVHPRPSDVVSLCEEEADRARSLAPGVEITVECDLPDPRAELDADVVGEVLANLLDNSRRHARSRIDVRIGCREVMLEIRVACDGPGLPEGAEELAFERFTSLDRRGGSGLGLPIAKGLAQAHDGDLTYENDEFLFTVPWRPVAVEPHAAAGPARTESE